MKNINNDKIKQSKSGKQIDKFIETARALGCDETDVSYEKVVKKLSEQKPQPRKPKKPKKDKKWTVV